MNYIFVKPALGRRCKDPKDGSLLPERGKNVPKNSYWLRRVKSGDCILSSPTIVGAVKTVVKKKKEPKKAEPIFETSPNMEADL